MKNSARRYEHAMRAGRERRFIPSFRGSDKCIDGEQMAAQTDSREMDLDFHQGGDPGLQD